MAPVVETRNLQKRYQKIEALAGVSVVVNKGEIFGLLGQNGAGKTTLIKILLGITSGWTGDAMLLGQPAGTTNVRARVGYLPEDHRFPEYHTGLSLLDFYGQLLGMGRADRRKRAQEMLELVGIAERGNYKIRTFSKGMKQRLGIAQALLHDPEVVFLDEPTDGVDPVGRRDIREMLGRLKGRGVTIFINSHLLGEVELICDRVAILRKGQMIREGSVASLTSQKGRFLIGLAPGQSFPTAAAHNLGYEVTPLAERWEVHLVEKRQSLEDLFLKTHDARPTLTGKAVLADQTGASTNVVVLKPAPEARPS